jgi:hypothetical protein
MELNIRGIPAEKILETHKLSDGRVILKVKNRKGEGDFRVAVFDPRAGRRFTPKHAHFAIDIFGKLCRDEKLTCRLLEAIGEIYRGSDAGSVLRGLNSNTRLELEKLPGYKIDYILQCLEFIFEQEDVNFDRYLKSQGGRLPDLRQSFLDRKLASYEEVTKGRFLAWWLFRRIVKDKIHPVEAMQEARLRI